VAGSRRTLVRCIATLTRSERLCEQRSRLIHLFGEIWNEDQVDANPDDAHRWNVSATVVRIPRARAAVERNAMAKYPPDFRHGVTLDESDEALITA
jgi:hypothetical protein